MSTGRAIHRAAQAELNAGFFTSWLERPPYRDLDPRFVSAVASARDWPVPEEYDELAGCVPPAPVHAAALPRFVVQDLPALQRLGGYEQHVARVRAVPTRPRNWHDFFNMSVWAHFPELRWALNALHVDEALGPKDPRNGRAPAQNVAAQFDESGMLVASSSPGVLEDLRALRFKRVFWERREELAETTRFWVIGHGTLESLLTPHLGLASKAALLELPEPPWRCDPDSLRHELDARVAALVRGWRFATPVLDPVPVLGIPGYADNAAPEFYDDARYFRFERRAR